MTLTRGTEEDGGGRRETEGDGGVWSGFMPAI